MIAPKPDVLEAHQVHPFMHRSAKPVGDHMFVWQKQKATFKWTLKSRNDGSWGRVVAVRKKLKRLGMSPREAQRVVMAIYNESAEDDQEHLKFEAEIFKGKQSAKEADVAWVAQVMGQKDVAADKAPSATAYSLYLWATSNDARTNSFWERIFPKTMPNQQQVNQSSRTRGTDSKLHDLIERAKARAAQDAD